MDIASEKTSTNEELPNLPESFIATAILGVGAFLYAALCGPVITQRGYPPMDPAWDAVTYLWLLPLILSAAFRRSTDPIRILSLATYALVTALVDAGTVINGVPNTVNREVIVSWTIIWYGPLHVTTAVIVELASVISQRICRRLFVARPVRQRALKWCFVSLVTLGMIIAPYAWREHVFASNRCLGRQAADGDWTAQKAQMRPSPEACHENFGDVRIDRNFDSATGFEFRSFERYFGFDEGYDRRVAELIAAHGIPVWSMKSHVVSSTDLASLLDSPDMVKVTQLPYKVTPDIVLSPGSFGLEIECNRNNHDLGYAPTGMSLRDKEPVFVGRLDQYPDLAFIRIGRKDVLAFHKSGIYLASAFRF